MHHVAEPSLTPVSSWSVTQKKTQVKIGHTETFEPLTAERVETQQMKQKQKQKHDAHAHERLLCEGDPVLVRNYAREELPPRGQMVSRYDCQEDRAGFVRGDNE